MSCSTSPGSSPRSCPARQAQGVRRSPHPRAPGGRRGRWPRRCPPAGSPPEVRTWCRTRPRWGGSRTRPCRSGRRPPFPKSSDQGGIDVDHDLVGWTLCPDDLAGSGQGPRDRPELTRTGGLDGPPRCRHRGDRAEELFLLLQRSEVGKTIGTIGHGHGEAGEHHAGIVGVPGDPTSGHGFGHGPREAAAVGELGQQRAPGVGDEMLAVGGHRCPTNRAIRVHLQGALLFAILGCLETLIFAGEEGFYADAHPVISGETSDRGQCRAQRPRTGRLPCILWALRRRLPRGTAIVFVGKVVWLPARLQAMQLSETCLTCESAAIDARLSRR